jgi:putative addiction module killer protein
MRRVIVKPPSLSVSARAGVVAGKNDCVGVERSLTICNRSITFSFVVSIKPLPEFTEWLDALSDASVRGVVAARIKRLERGLMGNVEPVGDGVSELRIHFGAGWRIYFVRRGAQLIVLLAGGSKRTQKTDIK